MTDTKIDRERWSASSRQSYIYQCAGESYADIHYECGKCQSAAVFSAEEQKRAFELKKNYIWQRRRLCPACNAMLWRLRTRERACQSRWCSERKVLARDEGFMREWLGILEAIPPFAPQFRNGMPETLTRLLQRLASAGAGRR
ncbi:hypothetical protein ACQ86G_03770 [Roseateles chitinivorans]|uniref:hypothetical protein n=1 Tax=Roseateles chitinivorans TaxID=2917965 RepID=UPI003D673023